MIIPQKYLSSKNLKRLMILETIIVLIFVLIDTSESESSIFLNYSAIKLSIIAIVSIILFSQLSLFTVKKLHPRLYKHINQEIKRFSESELGTFIILVSLVVMTFVMLIGSFIILLANFKLYPNNILFYSFDNLLPLIVLITFLIWEFAFLAKRILNWRIDFIETKHFLNTIYQKKWFVICWHVIIILFSTLHWIILITHWQILTMIDQWYWQMIHKSDFQHWMVIPLLLIYLIGYWLIISIKVPKKSKRWLVIFVGVIMIIGFAAMEGSPYLVLSEKRYIGGYRNYIAVAARNEGGTEFLYNYQETLSHDRFLATKPPGTYALYRGLLFVGSLVFPTGTYEEDYDAINHTLMILFPLLSLLTTVFVEKLTTKLSDIDPPHLPGYLLLIIPNYLLLQCTIDQAIIPLLVVIGLLWGIETFTQQNWWLTILFGSLIYLILYFSFSFLPFLMMLGIWIVLELWNNWKGNRGKFGNFILLSMLGFAIIAIIFYSLFGYNPWQQYLQSTTVHKAQRQQPETIKATIHMYLLNNLEFLIWIGVPMGTTAFFTIISAFLNMTGKPATSIDSLGIAVFLSYIFLNHFGNTISEVARLWLFFVPILSIFAIYFINKKIKKPKYTYTFIALQFITLYLMAANIHITWE